MKNRIFKIVLCLMLVLTPFTLMACGEVENKIEYTQLSNLVTEMKANSGASGLFKNGSVDGVSSDFVIRILNEDENDYFNECLIIPMNYLNKNLSEIEELKKVKDLNGEQSAAINRLEQNLYNLNDAYKALAREQEHINAFRDPSSDIYEGILAQFKLKTTNFIVQSYNVALALSDAQNQILNRFRSLRGRELKQEDSVLLRDNLALKIGQDYTKFLLSSLNSYKFASTGDSALQYEKDMLELISNSKIGLSALVRQFYGANSFKDLNNRVQNDAGIISYNNEKVTKLLESQATMDKERAMLNKAFENIYLYDLGKDYGFDLDAYKVGREDTEVYYNEITRYYRDYLDIQIKFLKDTLIG